MSDLTDAELPGYALIHCETEVAAFHKSHVARLLDLADQRDDANSVRTGHKDWYYLGPDVIRPIVKRIMDKDRATNGN